MAMGGTKVEVDLDRLVAVLNAAGARVTLDDNTAFLDPDCKQENLTAVSQRQCEKLGLEGWVGHRGATVVAFNAKELREHKAALEGVVKPIVDGGRLNPQENDALFTEAYSLIGAAEDAAVRAYLYGFLDGRVLRFVSDGMAREDMPTSYWDGCAVGAEGHHGPDHY